MTRRMTRRMGEKVSTFFGLHFECQGPDQSCLCLLETSLTLHVLNVQVILLVVVFLSETKQGREKSGNEVS